MNVRKLALTSTAIVALSALTAGHATAASVTTSATASVVPAATVQTNQPLQFGTFTVTTSGNITVAASDGTAGGTISTSGTQQGQFDYTAGTSNANVTVTLNALQTAGSASTLSVTKLSVDSAALTGGTTASTTTGAPAGSLQTSGVLSGSSQNGVGIGGGIDVGASQTDGSYSGDLVIEVTNT